MIVRVMLMIVIKQDNVQTNTESVKCSITYSKVRIIKSVSCVGQW